MIKEIADKFTQEDIYSMSLFSLYVLTDTKEYSTISELPYLVDRKSLLNLCKYYGGKTIKIPTQEELFTVLLAVQLYNMTELNQVEYKKAVEMLGIKGDRTKIGNVYKKVCEVMKSYEFHPKHK